MSNEFNEKILSMTGSNCIVDRELIQKLWSGYGELIRVKLDKSTVIVKYIKLPEEAMHPRNWNTDRGHKRKIKSYEVERHWYKNYNSNIVGAYFPRLIDCGEVEDNQFIILEDLQSKDFMSKDSVSWDEVKLCLSWLADFHRYHLGKYPKGLWDVGSYWHLDTRPDELEAIDDIALKEAAPLIDQKLNEAKFQTIIHGDAKLANFLFSDQQAAAIDFQYVGGGVGVKDIAYFLSSIYCEEDLEKYEEKALNHYFKCLNNTNVEYEWRELYPYAWCDFYRFLLGWSPGHWKINSYSENMKNRVLKCL